ncbi:RNA-binding S4 domain-containing protein [Chitinibacter bivalviorum]|uniref:RNA-binding S4 domain-containing protein n=1 Tax=Chitinibacter bivalviorum TaxID=2739434 RepID=A0A7H9BKS0_9NEIS|nr:RNA-binding S4 domain-containing protein [Chitinibacter bivalviorum]QLG89260.1 RNA-binding S4 domain-containing protein [Chitinibacter bivalviorum]
MSEHIFELRNEHIALCDLLKTVSIAPSGGIAKMMIAAGDVQVDGQVDTRKTAKIRVGMVVSVMGETIKVVQAS